MQIYQHKFTVTAAAGSTATTTLKIFGGLFRHLVILANTSTTVFRASLVDDNSLTIKNWGFSKGELNDDTISIPVSGAYVLNITNASSNDIFNGVLSVNE